MPRSTRRDSADWFQPSGRSKPRRRAASALTGGGAARAASSVGVSESGSAAASSAPSRAPSRALSGALAPLPPGAAWAEGRGRAFTDDDTRSVLSALSALDDAADGGAFPAELWGDLVDTFLGQGTGVDRYLAEQQSASEATRAAVRC
jgi:hypothetical protein